MDSNVKNIAILGSTGSIGTQALDIISEYPQRFRATLLTAGRNWRLLAEQARRFLPHKAVIADETALPHLREALSGLPVEVEAGSKAIAEAVTDSRIDTVVTAMVGYSGLLPTIEAIKGGKTIALANKETLVVAGDLITRLVGRHGASLVPVDSEHSAIFQCLQGEKTEEAEKIILTASGGPFRTWRREDVEKATAADALKHPNWSMGRKITIDSATMVNKGLEVMEARWLFGVDFDRIEVVVQPQSVIHSMVEFADGGIIAQLGTPDMKLPIQYALYEKERKDLPGARLDFGTLGKITFETPDFTNFPGLALAYQAGRAGGSVPTVFNAANEWAVSRFLDGKIGFLAITDMIEEAMENHRMIAHPTVEQILDCEAETYELLRVKA